MLDALLSSLYIPSLRLHTIVAPSILRSGRSNPVVDVGPSINDVMSERGGGGGVWVRMTNNVEGCIKKA